MAEAVDPKVLRRQYMRVADKRVLARAEELRREWMNHRPAGDSVRSLGDIESELYAISFRGIPLPEAVVAEASRLAEADGHTNLFSKGGV